MQRKLGQNGEALTNCSSKLLDNMASYDMDTSHDLQHLQNAAAAPAFSPHRTSGRSVGPTSLLAFLGNLRAIWVAVLNPY